MAFIGDDRIMETSTTTGTGVFTLAGAVVGYKAWSARFVNADIGAYAIVGVDANGIPTGEWETGIGTWGTGNLLTRTTVKRSSNANAVVTFSAGTKRVYNSYIADLSVHLDNQGVVNLPAAPAEPVTPATNVLSVYAASISGRMMLEGKSPSGVNYPYQPNLFDQKVVLFKPANTTTGTGSGFGANFQSNGTVTHPALATTNRATQIFKTQYANVATTTNQVLGVLTTVAQFSRGNAAGNGGFFFHCRFAINLWAAATCRLFAGMCATTNVITSDAPTTASFVGLSHITTDPNTGLGALNVRAGDGTTISTAQITLAQTLAANVMFDFYLYCPPAGTAVTWRLDDANTGTNLASGTVNTNLPAVATFMSPACLMSNGTANITAATVAPGVASIYCEADY